MKNIYIVFNITKDGKHHAIADTIRTGENLIPHINKHNANIAHLCESRTQAEQIAAAWNQSYKNNGTNLY